MNIEALVLKPSTTGRKPKIFNTDQGSQFTGKDWISELQKEGIQISMDGRGRWMDNVFIERLWRSLKYEKLRLWSYQTIPELRALTADWIWFWTQARLRKASPQLRSPAICKKVLASGMLVSVPSRSMGRFT